MPLLQMSLTDAHRGTARFKQAKALKAFLIEVGAGHAVSAITSTAHARRPLVLCHKIDLLSSTPTSPASEPQTAQTHAHAHARTRGTKEAKEVAFEGVDLKDLDSDSDEAKDDADADEEAQTQSAAPVVERPASAGDALVKLSSDMITLISQFLDLPTHAAFARTSRFYRSLLTLHLFGPASQGLRNMQSWEIPKTDKSAVFLSCLLVRTPRLQSLCVKVGGTQEGVNLLHALFRTAHRCDLPDKIFPVTLRRLSLSLAFPAIGARQFLMALRNCTRLEFLAINMHDAKSDPLNTGWLKSLSFPSLRSLVYVGGASGIDVTGIAEGLLRTSNAFESLQFTRALISADTLFERLAALPSLRRLHLQSVKLPRRATDKPPELLTLCPYLTDLHHEESNFFPQFVTELPKTLVRLCCSSVLDQVIQQNYLTALRHITCMCNRTLKPSDSFLAVTQSAGAFPSLVSYTFQCDLHDSHMHRANVTRLLDIFKSKDAPGKTLQRVRFCLPLTTDDEKMALKAPEAEMKGDLLRHAHIHTFTFHVHEHTIRTSTVFTDNNKHQVRPRKARATARPSTTSVFCQSGPNECSTRTRRKKCKTS